MVALKKSLYPLTRKLAARLARKRRDGHAEPIELSLSVGPREPVPEAFPLIGAETQPLLSFQQPRRSMEFAESWWRPLRDGLRGPAHQQMIRLIAVAGSKLRACFEKG